MLSAMAKTNPCLTVLIVPSVFAPPDAIVGKGRVSETKEGTSCSSLNAIPSLVVPLAQQEKSARAGQPLPSNYEFDLTGPNSGAEPLIDRRAVLVSQRNYVDVLTGDHRSPLVGQIKKMLAFLGEDNFNDGHN